MVQSVKKVEIGYPTLTIFISAYTYFLYRTYDSVFWSALATTPASISARAGAKKAINFIETFAFLLLLCIQP